MQERINIISNNLANINTDGYKSVNAGFVDLLYNKYYRAATRDPETGCGTRIEKTDIDFRQNSFVPTGNPYDYAIVGDGFFAVYDNSNGNVYYTRNGQFSLSNYSNEGNMFFLVNDQGHIVLDDNFGLLYVDPNDPNQKINIGVFDFNNKQGILLIGNNLYEATEQQGEPFFNENALVRPGMLEMSNVDLALEMSRVIEAQRAYQLSLRMLSTSDEIEQTINNLRG